jgi:hypothetical protein
MRCPQLPKSTCAPAVAAILLRRRQLFRLALMSVYKAVKAMSNVLMPIFGLEHASCQIAIFPQPFNRYHGFQISK